MRVNSVKGWGHTPKSNSTHLKLTAQKTIQFKKPTLINRYSTHFYEPKFTDHRRLAIQTTTVHRISSKNYAACNPPWVVATTKKQQLLHPLTLKPHHLDLPQNFSLSNFSYFKYHLTSFHRTEFNFDKLIIPLPRSKVISNDTLLVLYGGGNLIGRPFLVDNERSTPWVKLSEGKFDDIIVFAHYGQKDPKIYVVDRLGKLHVICNNVTSRVLRFNTTIDSEPIEGGSDRVGWRKRFVEYFNALYLVVRLEEKVFRVYELIKQCNKYSWNQVKVFGGGGLVLFVSRDCCFLTSDFQRKEYGNCIVFSEAGFPKYGDDGWEYNADDEIWMFGLTDGSYDRVGESDDFPEIDWSPPSWALDEGSCLSSRPRSPSESEPDENDGGVQSDSKDSTSEDEKDQEVMELDSDSQVHDQEEASDSDIHDLDSGKRQCDSNSQEMEDEEINSDDKTEGDAALQEDVPPSIAAVSAAEEEVTRTLLRMNGANEATERDTSRITFSLSALTPCTSSKTKNCQNDSSNTKFEGFDVRSDLIPVLKKIWQKHGNIIENSTMRSSDIIGRALESLATMVQILDNNSVESLSDCQVDYLSLTLSDLKTMCFKVQWLSSSVEKAVELHKSKPLVDSLNKLSQLSSQVKERRAILQDEVAKLTEEENKLIKEMAKVSKLIPFSGQVKFDEPVGSGLT